MTINALRSAAAICCAWILVAGCTSSSDLANMATPRNYSHPGETNTMNKIVHGDLLSVDFYIPPGYGMDPSWEGVYNGRLTAVSRSLRRCDGISLPGFQTPFGLLMSIDSTRIGEVHFKTIAQYIRQQTENDAYRIVDIMYYLPTADPATGRIGSICKNGFAEVNKSAYVKLAGGWHRMVLSSEAGFYSSMQVSCTSLAELEAHQHNFAASPSIVFATNDLERMWASQKKELSRRISPEGAGAYSVSVCRPVDTCGCDRVAGTASMVAPNGYSFISFAGAQLAGYGQPTVFVRLPYANGLFADVVCPADGSTVTRLSP